MTRSEKSQLECSLCLENKPHEVCFYNFISARNEHTKPVIQPILNFDRLKKENIQFHHN